ncbi:hypothetical protein rosag_05520 [Roseisolibacter agri]|uniref:Uncharacterized protein n=1 Tax=Roseisolibacter agri TaxID=2014610 RepID=A0AA37Q0A9_9BACT|nr:hypothetical protein rosag_05520 [Roseisolibacter agri]
MPGDGGAGGAAPADEPRALPATACEDEVDAGQRDWGATVGAALIGGALCGALAWLGLPLLGGAGAVALAAWVAWRAIRSLPGRTRPRPGPATWSSYDRRRSGRPRLRERLLRWLRPRRRAARHAGIASTRDASRPRTLPPRPGAPRRSRERDAH